MLNTYSISSDSTDAKTAEAFWVDLFNPTPEESAKVSAQCGINIPSREFLQEIESSSRLRAEGQALCVSMPLAIQDDATGLLPVPLGFILSKQQLITVRYSEVHAFADVRARVERKQCLGSADVFAALIDGMVDTSADMLEKMSRDLAAVSGRAFGRRGVAPPRYHLSIGSG